MSFAKAMLAAVLCVSTLGLSAVAAHDAPAAPQERVEMTARIDRIGEKIEVTVLESPYVSGSFWVITGEATVYRTKDGAALTRSDLREGDTVRILYSGQVMLSYPPQIVAAVMERI